MAKTQINTKTIKNYSILNEDIAVNANINQSKISGLLSDLNELQIQINTKEPRLPSIINNAGKYLKTDGTNLLWDSVSSGSNSNNPIVYNFQEILLQTNWIYDNTNNIYTYTLSNVNFYSYSYVEVIPDNTSIGSILYSEIYPKVQINNGNIVIYAKRIPETSISVFINIINKSPNIFDLVNQNNLNIDGLLGTFFIVNITIPNTYTFDLQNITPSIFYYVLIKNNSGNDINITLPNVNTIRSCDSLTILDTKIKEVSILFDGTDYIFQISEDLYK